MVASQQIWKEFAHDKSQIRPLNRGCRADMEFCRLQLERYSRCFRGTPPESHPDKVSNRDSGDRESLCLSQCGAIGGILRLPRYAEYPLAKVSIIRRTS